MVRNHFTRGEIWEIIIVIAIVLIVIYRFLLVYDFLPDAYQPSTIFFNMYDGTKAALRQEEEQPSFVGHTSKWILEHLKATENYVHEQQDRYKTAEEVAERCKENMIFRWFMYMGDADNPNCTESGIRMKEAVQQINTQTHPGAKNVQPAQEQQPVAPVQPATPPPAGAEGLPGPAGIQPVSVPEPQSI